MAVGVLGVADPHARGLCGTSAGNIAFETVSHVDHAIRSDPESRECFPFIIISSKNVSLLYCVKVLMKYAFLLPSWT